MKVGLFGPYPPPHGGVEINVVALHDYLRKKGVRCEVVNLTRHRKQPQPDVCYPRGAFDVLRLLLRRRYDVVHLHVGGDLDPRALVLGMLSSWLPGTRTVFTLHSGGYPTSPAGRATTRRGLRAFAFRRFDALIAVNDEIRGFFERLGVPPDRIHVITPAAISTEQIEAVHATDAGTLFTPEMLAFRSSHDPLLVSVGGLESEYDIPTQIDALGKVRELRTGAGLVVIGGGSLAAEIEGYARSRPWGQHVFFAGDVGHRAAMRAIADADVFLRTTLYDGDAISVREALHFGAPVVATDNGMRPEGTTLIPRSDAAALADAVVATLSGGGRPAPVPGDQRGVEETLRLYIDVSSRGKRRVPSAISRDER